MAKIKLTNDELLEILAERLGGKQEKGNEVEFPASLKELNALDEDGLQELAGSLQIEFEDKDEDELRGLLKTVYYLLSEKEDKIEEEDAEALATAVGIEAAKKLSKTIELLKEYFSSDEEEEKDDDAGETEEEEKDEESEVEEEEAEAKSKKKKKADEDKEEEEESEEESEDEEEEEKPKKKKPASDDDEESDEEGEDEVDDDTKTERLDEFNEAASKDERIAVKKLGLDKAYAKLEELLEDDDENVAEWGKPYIKNETGMCCGLEMADHVMKGSKEQHGECRVTGKVFRITDEGEFVPLKKK